LSEVAKTSILKKGSPPLNHSSRNWLPRSQFSARLSGLSRSDLVPWHFCNVAQEQFVFISTPASPIKLLFRDAGAIDNLGPAADIAVEPL